MVIGTRMAGRAGPIADGMMASIAAEQPRQRRKGPVMTSAAIFVENGMRDRNRISLVDAPIGGQPGPRHKHQGCDKRQPFNPKLDTAPPRPLDIIQLDGLLQLFRIMQHGNNLLLSRDAES